MKRLTDATRQRARLQAELQARLEQATHEELQWLWRRVRVKLRTTSTQIRKVSYYENQAIWERFEERLHKRLIDLVADGIVPLFALEESLARMQPLAEPFEFSYQSVLNSIEGELAKQIRRVRISTQRQVAARINQWFATPGETMEAIVRDLSPQFGRPRAALIAQTEVTRANSLMQEHVAAVLGIEQWWWQTKRDATVCIKRLRGPDGAFYKGCRELHGKVFKVGMPMPPEGSHVGCRCSGVLMRAKRKAVDLGGAMRYAEAE
jgi:hypothetical protein